MFRWKEGVKNQWITKDDHFISEKYCDPLQTAEKAPARTHFTGVSSFGATRLVKHSKGGSAAS